MYADDGRASVLATARHLAEISANCYITLSDQRVSVKDKLLGGCHGSPCSAELCEDTSFSLLFVA